MRAEVLPGTSWRRKKLSPEPPRESAFSAPLHFYLSKCCSHGIREDQNARDTPWGCLGWLDVIGGNRRSKAGGAGRDRALGKSFFRIRCRWDHSALLSRRLVPRDRQQDRGEQARRNSQLL